MRALLVAMLSVVLVAPASSQELKTHRLVFYLDPGLVTDLAWAQAILPQYVADLNTILAKNTLRRFTFDPAIDLVMAPEDPSSGSAGTLPLTGYEVWVHAVLSDQPRSYDGYMGFDRSGAAVLDGFKWLQLYDPEALAPDTPEMRDYWTQIDHVLHEFAHVFGAGNGEYYNLAQVTDVTGEAPTLDIRFMDYPADPYWGARPSYIADPLLANAYAQAMLGDPRSRAALLATVRYADLTAAIMNGDYRNPQTLPPTVDLSRITVLVRDGATDRPIPAASIDVWHVGADGTWLAESLVADGTGAVVFPWGALGDPHNNYDFLRLLKLGAPGYAAAAEYVSIYDTDEALLLRGETVFSRVISLQPDSLDGTPPTVAITGPSDGSRVKRNSRITIAATASDASGIQRVEIRANGALLCTPTAAPYACVWRVPKQPGTYQIEATAYDQPGNAATASVTVRAR